MIKALAHFLVWLIVVAIALWLIGDEFHDYALVAIFTVLFIDYIAMRVVWIKYLPFAFIGAVLATLLHIYVI